MSHIIVFVLIVNSLMTCTLVLFVGRVLNLLMECVKSIMRVFVPWGSFSTRGISFARG